jgi:hypothetical protein
MKLITIALLSLTLASCASRGGPFVTNISNDGDGNLVIEKCMLRFEPFMSTVHNDSCNSSKMKIK